MENNTHMCEIENKLFFTKNIIVINVSLKLPAHAIFSHINMYKIHIDQAIHKWFWDTGWETRGEEEVKEWMIASEDENVEIYCVSLSVKTQNADRDDRVRHF